MNFLLMLIGLATGIITARGLAPAERGVLVGLVLWVGVLGVMSVMGLDEAIIRSARGSGVKAFHLRRELKSTTTLSAGAGVIAFLAIGVYLQQDVGPNSLLVALAGAVIVPLNTITQCAFAILRADTRLGTWNAVRLLPPVVYIGLLLPLTALGQLTVLNAVGCLLLANVITAGTARLLTRLPVGADGSELTGGGAECRRYGRRLLKAQVPLLISQRVDQLFLVWAALPSALGIYSVAASMAAVCQLISTSSEQYLFPRYCLSLPSTARLLATSLIACLAVAPVGLGLVLFGEEMISAIYGRSYVGATRPLIWLCIALFMQAACAPLTAYVKATGALSWHLWAQYARLAATLSMMPFLHQDLGIEGVAIAVTIGSGVGALILAFGSMRRPS